MTYLKIFYWKAFECEICKTLFPFRFKVQNGRKYSLLDIEVEKNKNMMLIESIAFEKQTSKLIYMLTPQYTNFAYKLGRGND